MRYIDGVGSGLVVGSILGCLLTCLIAAKYGPVCTGDRFVDTGVYLYYEKN